jgi:DNA-binding NarL/FixJ family response regulator
LVETDAIRVLIADDHPAFREGLGAVLVSCGFAVAGLAGNGREALELAIRLRPEVVLMDINMPVVNGVEATRLIRARLPQVQVVGLSMHEAERTRRDMNDAGAAAYLNKSASVEKICDAIRGAAASV